MEFSDDAIIGKTLDGTITTWNRGAEQLYGYTAAEAIGSHISILTPIGYDHQIKQFLDALRQGKIVEATDTFRARKDGTLLDISVRISPIYDHDGKVIGASAIARDIRQLKKVQRELEERETQNRLLLESTAEAIIGLGPDGTCTFVNPACIRMLGFQKPEELVGRHIHNLVHAHVEGSGHKPEECPLASVLRTNEGAHSDDEVFSRADRTTFLSEYWSYPIKQGSQTVGVVVTFLDVTARKRNENEIRTGSRRREEFLAMLSHELRNPLAAVMNATSVLQSANPGSEATNRARLIIERQSRHMARLLDDLLDVSRITRGGIELHRDDVDLRSVISTAIEATAPVLADRTEPVVTNITNDKLIVRGDSDRLQQVLVNLISNAARYAPSDTPIWLSAAVEGGMAVIRVKDIGRGIPQHMLGEIFELFVQNEQGLERSKGGLGIGLTLVRKIVELHGGTVDAYSNGPGTGSEFVVKLPRQSGVAAKQSIDPVDRSARARRILVVEDQDDSREMMCCLLSLKGHSVLEASDGMGAVDAIETHHPDIAFVDIGLPILNGYEVAQRVRANPLLDNVVLVALTGYGRDQDIAAAKAAGFDEHVAKPADTSQLDAIVAKWNGHGRPPRR